MDGLSTRLAEMGHRIAEEGCGADPAVSCLAEAARVVAPASAAVLECEAEPEATRSRAFLKVALAVEGLPATERLALDTALASHLPEPLPGEAGQPELAIGAEVGPELEAEPIAAPNRKRRIPRPAPTMSLLPSWPRSFIGSASKV